MKKVVIYTVFLLLTLISCNNTKENSKKKETMINKNLISQNGYSQINGIKMYYEIYGEGTPLVLLHGGGSTIQTTFGRVIPLLAKNRKLICVELQAHGRTGDRNTEISFEQDADDVAELLNNVNIIKADIFGFSNGGNTALQLAIRHPDKCNKIVAGSVLLKRNGTFPQFWKFMKKGTFEQMPKQYKEAFIEVNPDSSKLLNMYQKCANRMNNFKDFSDQQLKSIKSQVLLINGNEDVALPEHIVAMSRLIPNCKLAIVPGGHGEYIGEIITLKPDYRNRDFIIIPIIESFINTFETKN